MLYEMKNSGIIKTVIEFLMKVTNIIVEMIEWKLEVWNMESMNEMTLWTHGECGGKDNVIRGSCINY